MIEPANCKVVDYPDYEGSALNRHRRDQVVSHYCVEAAHPANEGGIWLLAVCRPIPFGVEEDDYAKELIGFDQGACTVKTNGDCPEGGRI